MPFSRSIILVAACAVVPAAAESLVVQPGQAVTRRIALSKEEVRKEPVLWVQADPNHLRVRVTAPDGRQYTDASPKEKQPVVIEVADHQSGSETEVMAAQWNGDGVFIRWRESAAPGAYVIHLNGVKLSAPLPVNLRHATSAELLAEHESAARKEREELLARIYAAPERRAKVDDQGNATLTLEGAWGKDDVIVTGSTLEAAWTVVVKLPDGTEVTQENAGKVGCEWSRSAGAAAMMMPMLLRVDLPHVAVSCAERLGQGAITLTMHTDAAPKGAELAAAVVRPTELAATLDAGMKQMSERPNTVALVHHQKAEHGPSGFEDGLKGEPVKIRLSLAGGPDLAAGAAVTCAPYMLDPKVERGPSIFGPDPSKKSYGPASAVPREPGGGFVYTFTGREMGTYQMDCKATGTFQNGRHFEAIATVAVLVTIRAANITGVHQQRMDRTNSGKADGVQFLLDLDVKEPGDYESFIALQDGAGFASSRDRLTAGKHTITLHGDPPLAASLDAHPDEALRVDVRYVRDDGARFQFQPLVLWATAIPKARDFQQLAVGRNGIGPARATWRVADSELTIAVPVEASGSGCIWSASLGIEPRQASAKEPARTVLYRQSGSFVARNGAAVIESRWPLAPFYSTVSFPARQAFVFRLHEARCGGGEVQVEDGGEERTTGEIFIMPFTASLEGVTARPAALHGGAGSAVVSAADKDGDGKLDQVAIDLDIEAPGGTCLWMGSVEADGSGFGVAPRAQTKPGLNHLTIDVSQAWAYAVAGAAEPVIRFSIGYRKCGENPQMTRQDFESQFRQKSMLFEQIFAVDRSRFAAPPR